MKQKYKKASILGNPSTGKGVIRASEGAKKAGQSFKIYLTL